MCKHRQLMYFVYYLTIKFCFQMLLFSSSVLKSEDYGSIGSFLNTLQTKPIKKAQSAVKGTQLKLLLSLENDLQVIFKPKWLVFDQNFHICNNF